jgi:LmbE family N-acetylglucosaminyl deacetylase
MTFRDAVPEQVGMNGLRLRLHAERPARLLVVAAHPGDADRALAGSVARWVGEGSAAHLVCCTSGDASADEATADPLEVATRREGQQRASAAIAGYAAVTFLHRPDGAVANDLALREQLVRIVRTFQPDAVAAPDPRDLIRASGAIVPADVRATGEAAIDAIEPARRAMAFPSLVSADGLAPHAVTRLYLYDSERASVAVDITASLHAKLAAVREITGSDSASPALADDVRGEAAAFGSLVGLAAAEAFALIELPS